MRVGLTGGLGSGKSTVAGMLQARGAFILSADEIARELMYPGTAVHGALAQRFGARVINPDSTLNRAELARLAFAENRVDELNAIIHPATIAEQEQLASAIFAGQPNAVVVVESALIFETVHGPGWRARFDHLVLVTAPEQTKIARFVARSGGGSQAALEAEARRRLAHLIPDKEKIHQVDFVLRNDGTLDQLRQQVNYLWDQLRVGPRDTG